MSKRPKPKTDAEWNAWALEKIEHKIRQHVAKYGPCAIAPGMAMEWRDPDGRMTGVDGKDYPKHYAHGGILRDYWMEKLGGDLDYFAPKK